MRNRVIGKAKSIDKNFSQNQNSFANATQSSIAQRGISFSQPTARKAPNQCSMGMDKGKSVESNF